MRFGVREICDVVFKAKSDVKIGSKTFKKGQPVLYIDTAKTSNIEGAATTVYAQGGKGNTRLIAWEGEKTLTFTVEDALLSPIGFSVLSGAGLIKQPSASDKVHVHMTTNALMDASGEINLKDALGTSEIDTTAPIFVVKTEGDGSVTGDILIATPTQDSDNKYTKLVVSGVSSQAAVFVDYYVAKAGNTISELQIDAANFAGYYYVEASTLFRRQEDGVDMPAEITFPNVKIQSNFTFAMASSGDPSTFSFTMDAFPGYTYFDQTRKVLCVIQVIEDAEGKEENIHSVMGHKDAEEIDTAFNDSTAEKLTVAVAVQPAFATPAEATLTGEPLTATIELQTSPVCSPDVVTFALSGNTADEAGSYTATVTYSVDATKLANYNTTYGRNYTAADVILPEAKNLAWTAVSGG